MENNRAMRRHHVERLKKKRKRYWAQELSPQQQGKAIHTPALCSCWMCGNPRKHFGELTIQERRKTQQEKL